jgi:hypothetical protein
MLQTGNKESIGTESVSQSKGLTQIQIADFGLQIADLDSGNGMDRFLTRKAPGKSTQSHQMNSFRNPQS